MPSPETDVALFLSGPMDTGVSGGDVHALRLAERLRAARRPSRLVTVPAMRSHLPDGVRDAVMEVRTPLDGHVRSMPVYFAAVALRALIAAVRAPRARVSLATTHFFFDVVPVAVNRRRSRGAGAAFVYHLVGESGRPSDLRSRVSTVLEAASLRLLRRVGDLVFVDNPDTREALLRRGFRAEQLVTTGNGYDPLIAMPEQVAPSRPTVVFCGRLVEAKGVWAVLALARALADRLPQARIVMIGDGPLRAELERRLEAEGTGNVDLLGFVEEAEKWRLLRSASAFVSPSVEEGWGIAVGEALIAGLPAVVYDLPAYFHFGELPLRVPLRDEAAFVEATVGLLADDARLAAERGRVGAAEATLPRWAAILDAEIAAMDRLTARD